MRNKLHYLSYCLFFVYNLSIFAQETTPNIADFTSITPTEQQPYFVIPESHRFQVLVQSGDDYLSGGGQIPARNDFTGYVPIDGSSEKGYLSINHENPIGGVSILDIHYDVNSLLWVVDDSEAVPINSEDLVQTIANCSGTVTSWNTVISCEEFTSATDFNNDGYNDVGWCLEIDPATRQVMEYGNGKTEKLWALGNMAHENVVVANDERTVYLGEDGNTACVYKFIADEATNLYSGKLYTLVLDADLVDGEPTITTGKWVQVPNDTPEERNVTYTVAADLGGNYFGLVEDVEISPLDGKIYFAAKEFGRVYRFTDDGETVSDFEVFVGGQSYEITTSEETFTTDWGRGNDNLAFDDKGNLWVLQDGSNDYIWVVAPTHSQEEPDVRIFATTPIGSEPTGITFSPDYRFLFMSIQHPDDEDNLPQLDATFNEVTINRATTLVIALADQLGAQLPVADFGASEIEIPMQSVVYFTDSSIHQPTAWEWTFEGGTPETSTEAAPIIYYETAGTYDVSLKVTNIVGTDSLTKTDFITVTFPTNTTTVSPSFHISILPNPSKNQATINIPSQIIQENTQLKLYNSIGKLIQIHPLSTQQNSINISTKDLASGVYFLQINKNGKILAKEKMMVIK